MRAKIWNTKAWIRETDPTKLQNIFDAMVTEACFNVIGKCEHYFEPQGYTKIYLLAESHFAIHTFPEHGKTYIELSSCNKEKQKRFNILLKQYRRQAE